MYVRNVIVCIFLYVSAVGHTARAIARNRAGPLSAESHSRGELVSAPDGHLQRRSATLPCGTIAIQAGALGKMSFRRISVVQS